MTNVSPLFPDLTAAPDRFDKFWSWVPRRIGKRAARKAWDKALGEGVAPDDIIAGAKRWHAEWRARLRHLAGEDRKRELGFCPHPSTWLNAGRWDDEDGVLTTPDESHSIVAKSDLTGPLAEEWSNVLKRLHEREPAMCRAWFLPLTLVSTTADGRPVLSAPSQFFAMQVNNTYRQLIEMEWGRRVTVMYGKAIAR